MKPRFVSFHYIVKNKAGAVLDSSYEGEPIMYLEGTSEIMPGLAAGLKEMKPGDRKSVFIQASEAYGVRNERLVIEVPITALPHKEKLKEGQKFQMHAKDRPDQVFRVVKVNDRTAILDGNHPLAGEDLFFDIEVKDAREAKGEAMPVFNQKSPSSNN